MTDMDRIITLAREFARAHSAEMEARRQVEHHQYLGCPPFEIGQKKYEADRAEKKAYMARCALLRALPTEEETNKMSAHLLELPEPDEVDDDYLAWTSKRGAVIVDKPGRVTLDEHVYEGEYPAAQMRELGLVLLAAAEAAEKFRGSEDA
jgi:hypothetical protein